MLGGNFSLASIVANDAPVDAISSISPSVSSLESICIIRGSFGGLIRIGGSLGGRGGRSDISDLRLPGIGFVIFELLGAFLVLDWDEFFGFFEGWSLLWVCLFSMFYWSS